MARPLQDLWVHKFIAVVLPGRIPSKLCTLSTWIVNLRIHLALCESLVTLPRCLLKHIQALTSDSHAGIVILSLYFTCMREVFLVAVSMFCCDITATGIDIFFCPSYNDRDRRQLFMDKRMPSSAWRLGWFIILLLISLHMLRELY